MAATPELILPAEGATLRLGSAVFSWEPVDGGADTYALQIASDDGFTDIVSQKETTLTQAEQVFEAGALYYWRVQAKQGETILTSTTVRSFSAPPFVPAQLETHATDGNARLLTQFKEDA